MRFYKSGITLAAFLLIYTPLIIAQNQQPQQPDIPAPDEIGDEELIRFVDISDSIQPIQLEAQNEIQGMIEDEGMTIERFQQIMMSMTQPQDSSQVNISVEERQMIQSIQPQLMQVQMEAEEEIVTEIEENGFELRRFQGIYASLQQHPELLERLQGLIESEGE